MVSEDQEKQDDWRMTVWPKGKFKLFRLKIPVKKSDDKESLIKAFY